MTTAVATPLTTVLGFEAERKALFDSWLPKIQKLTETSEELCLKHHISEEDELSSVSNEVMKFQILLDSLKRKYGIYEESDDLQIMDPEEETVKSFFQNTRKIDS